MRRIHHRALLASVIVSLSICAPLAGQRAGPVRASLLPEPPSVVVSLPPFGQDAAPTGVRPTTFLERAAWGAGAGFLGVAAASVLAKDDGDAWVAIPLIGAASAAGVMLVAAKHEGARPLPTVLGTALAMTLPAIVLASMEPTPEGPGPEIVVGFALLVAAPLGAAAGHGLGVR